MRLAKNGLQQLYMNVRSQPPLIQASVDVRAYIRNQARFFTSRGDLPIVTIFTVSVVP